MRGAAAFNDDPALENASIRRFPITLSKEARTKRYGELGYQHKSVNNVGGFTVDLGAVRSLGRRADNARRMARQCTCGRDRYCVRPGCVSQSMRYEGG